jgi:hypothetical protein
LEGARDIVPLRVPRGSKLCQTLDISPAKLVFRAGFPELC